MAIELLLGGCLPGTQEGVERPGTQEGVERKVSALADLVTGQTLEGTVVEVSECDV